MVAAFLSTRLLLIVSNLHSFSEAPVLLLTLPSLTAGGLLLTVIATIFYLRLRQLPLLQVLDAWAAPGLLLWAALALGHLAEGSDPGLPAARFGLKTSLAGYREQPVALYVRPGRAAARSPRSIAAPSSRIVRATSRLLAFCWPEPRSSF